MTRRKNPCLGDSCSKQIGKRLLRDKAWSMIGALTLSHSKCSLNNFFPKGKDFLCKIQSLQLLLGRRYFCSLVTHCSICSIIIMTKTIITVFLNHRPRLTSNWILQENVQKGSIKGRKLHSLKYPSTKLSRTTLP